ncbi:hypothetical protein LWI29_000703 [Acer saccharum]|uniref:Uncharacterized protein n=1 Tax=Acer saccharum TaxID=4024 RepID=A0AA39SQ70_ACESA|nr:hypothetical protein LWI29_000703 [Acer saccharum]
MGGSLQNHKWVSGFSSFTAYNIEEASFCVESDLRTSEFSDGNRRDFGRNGREVNVENRETIVEQENEKKKSKRPKRAGPYGLPRKLGRIRSGPQRTRCGPSPARRRAAERAKGCWSAGPARHGTWIRRIIAGGLESGPVR